ncbi:SH3 domain-containing protein [Fluviibacterium sp. DFM31]|uniref:SH3 domain-containing protein n=1 Tax=Meridianimarinicoccus marinus TaxID=3231483 RepID=A0ABV3L702_9RHOB
MSDRLTGRETVLYQVGAEAGQTMTVSLTTDNAAAYFNVYAPGAGPGDAALAVGSLIGPMMPDLNRFEGVLPTSGTYTISVYLYRAAARRDEVAAYTLDVAVTGATGAVVQGDFADGLAGGPDFYQVATSAGGPLNLRAGPSHGAAVMVALPNGTSLRNLGCRMAEGRRWCRVATLADPGNEGWAAGDFLVEGSGTSAPAPMPASDVAVGGTDEQRVRFDPGASGAELIGTLPPGASRRYVLGAKDGQFLFVRVAGQGPGLSYQIFNPDRSFLLDQMSPDKEYRGQLWQTGDHVVEVINRGNAAVGYNVIFGIE